MTANESLERQVADYYATEAPQRAPDWVLRSALETIEHTPQRRVVIRVPRRFQHMNTYAKVAIAAVVVIAVGIAGLSFLKPASPSGVGGQPSASPSPSPSAAPRPSPGASTVAPPALTETFTSARHGLSISYPAGWVARAAIEPSTTGFPNFDSPQADVMYDPVLQDHLFVSATSQPLAGKSGAQWVDDLLAELTSAGDCGPPIELVTIDGIQGKLCGSSAAVSAGDRGYAIVMYTSGDDPAAVAGYDQEYFKAILATVQLTPENAVDAPASVSPSPS